MYSEFPNEGRDTIMKIAHKLTPAAFLLFSLLLAACNRSDGIAPIEAAETPTSQADESFSIGRNTEILAACSPEEQAKAMRADQMPDWEQLHLQACYELTLDLQPESAQYSGEARITYTNQAEEPLEELIFRLYPNSPEIFGGKLEVREVSSSGTPLSAQVFLSDSSALRVPLPAPLLPAETIQLDMSFAGQTPVDFGDLEGTYGVFNYASEQKVLTLANWFPILAAHQTGGLAAEEVVGIGDAVVSRTALYRVELEAPSGWKVITTGSETEKQTGDKRSNIKIASGPVRDFIILASPNLELQQATLNGIQINHWGLPAGRSRWIEGLESTTDAVDVFQRRFGAYPYREMDVVMVPLRWALGVEYPGLFLMGDSMYESNPESPFLLGLVIAHEVAHQWWYGVVGNDVLADPWQDEGLSTFSSLLYQQEHQQQYYRGTLDFYQGRIQELEQAPGDKDIAQPVEAFSNREELYSPVVYTKGGLFFHALRERLGDETFFRAIRSYYEQNRYELASPQALLGTFEQTCNCNLDRLYTDWGAEK